MYFFNITIAHVVCTENSQNKAHNHSNIWYTFNFAMLNSFVLHIFFSVFCHSILYMFFMLVKKFKPNVFFLNNRILIKRSLNTHCFRSMYVCLIFYITVRPNIQPLNSKMATARSLPSVCQISDWVSQPSPL